MQTQQQKPNALATSPGPGALGAPARGGRINPRIIPPDGYLPGQRMAMANGRHYVRIFPRETLENVLTIFRQNTRRGLDTLVRLNAKVLARRNGRVTPRSNQWLLVPEVWVFPERRMEIKLRAANRAARRLLAPVPRKRMRGELRGTLGANWWEDSCPAGKEPVYDDEGDIIDCIEPAASGNGDDVNWGQGCGGELAPGLYAGYFDSQGNCVDASSDGSMLWDPASQSIVPAPGGDNTVDPDAGKGCGGEGAPGLYYGFFDASGKCVDASTDGSMLWNPITKQVVPNPNNGPNDKPKPDKPGPGGPDKPGPGGPDKPGPGGPDKPTSEKTFGKKALEFVQKPIVFGSAIAAAVIAAGVAVNKKRRRST